MKKKSISKEIRDQARLVFSMLLFFCGSAWLFFVLPQKAATYLFESHSSMTLRTLWFVVVIPIVIALGWLITSEKAIKTNWIKPNLFSLIIVGFVFFAISGMLFSTSVYLLAKNQLVNIVPIDRGHTITLASLMDLFWWHFFEAIPSLHVNKLLKFNEPYEFDGMVGALVLLFQLSVIFPIIRFQKKVNEFKRKLKNIGEEYAKAWCSQNPESVADFFTEKGILIVNDEILEAGRNGIAKVVGVFMTAYPDLKVTMDGLKAGLDGTEFHWTLSGTNSGPNGSGKKIKISGFELWQLNSEGLIIESKGNFATNPRKE